MIEIVRAAQCVSCPRVLTAEYDWFGFTNCYKSTIAVSLRQLCTFDCLSSSLSTRQHLLLIFLLNVGPIIIIPTGPLQLGSWSCLTGRPCSIDVAGISLLETTWMAAAVKFGSCSGGGATLDQRFGIAPSLGFTSICTIQSGSVMNCAFPVATNAYFVSPGQRNVNICMCPGSCAADSQGLRLSIGLLQVKGTYLDAYNAQLG